MSGFELYQFKNCEEVQNPSEFQKQLCPNRAVFAFSQVCPHCQNSCTVTMDDSDFEEPCPWCDGGRRRSHEYATRSQAGGNPSNVWFNREGRMVYKPDWYADVDLSKLSWNRGRTIYHVHECESVWCSEPVTGVSMRCRKCAAGRSNPVFLSVPEMVALWRRVEQVDHLVERRRMIRAVIDSKRKKRGAA